VSLTRDFQATVRARAQADPEFRRALLCQGVESVLFGDIDTGKAVLRDYVNATLGFRALAKGTGIPAKSLMRMLSAGGRPSSVKLAAILRVLQRNEGVRLEVRAVG
jgi:DNA-binding phage protein